MFAICGRLLPVPLPPVPPRPLVCCRHPVRPRPPHYGIRRPSVRELYFIPSWARNVNCQDELSDESVGRSTFRFEILSDPNVVVGLIFFLCFVM